MIDGIYARPRIVYVRKEGLGMTFWTCMWLASLAVMFVGSIEWYRIG